MNLSYVPFSTKPHWDAQVETGVNSIQIRHWDRPWELQEMNRKSILSLFPCLVLSKTSHVTFSDLRVEISVTPEFGWEYPTHLCCKNSLFDKPARWQPICFSFQTNTVCKGTVQTHCMCYRRCRRRQCRPLRYEYYRPWPRVMWGSGNIRLGRITWQISSRITLQITWQISSPLC